MSNAEGPTLEGPAAPRPPQPQGAAPKQPAPLPPPGAAPGMPWTITPLSKKLSGATRWANLSIIALVVGFVGWAAVVPLTQAAIAPGVVSPEGSRKTVQHLEGGIVKKILVKDGDLVQAGQTLIEMDGTQANASVAALQNQWLRLRAMRQRLLALTLDKAELVFDADILEAAKTSPDFADFLENERNLFATGMGTKNGQDEILKQQIAQSKEEIDGLRSVVAGLDRQLALITQELEGVRKLNAKGLVPRTRLLALERAAADLSGQRAANLATIARAEQRISQIEVQRLAAKTEFNRDQSKEILSGNAQIAEIEEKLGAARDVQKRTSVVAPVTGYVVGLVVKSPGAVLRPGEPIMEVVPNGVDMVIDARLQPNDIESVHPGLTADVQITPYSHRYSKRLQGRVTKVSADTLFDEASRQNYYKVTIVVDAEELKTNAPEVALAPGMPAEVFIDTGMRTMLDYFFQPITRTFSHAFKD
ncbi:MAG: HlyD family type I secretion periplasmic adaptor subunit [Alphaproteobacteria bacterium]|nr:HlyD family type I secretion periplasmic adaptor subunit [Alphaproteobacteria bacterium]